MTSFALRDRPESVPLETGAVLAPPSSAATGGVVAGIRCDASEQVALHIHTHLAVFVDGALRPTPAGIGIVTPVAQQTANRKRAVRHRDAVLTGSTYTPRTA